MDSRLKKRIFIDGLLPMINVKSEEKEMYTLLGSTDRKGYTVKTTAQFQDEQLISFTDVQPFIPQGDQVYIIRKIEDKLKYRLAEKIYELAENNHEASGTGFKGEPVTKKEEKLEYTGPEKFRDIFDKGINPRCGKSLKQCTEGFGHLHLDGDDED